MTPEVMSQAEHVLWHMQVYGRITPLEALREYGCMRLAARIHELRARGHQIEALTSRDGYAVYFMRPGSESVARSLWGDR